ncbi:2-amino-4-hydroxy-6-hydroxymethyldihydropteridine diphosphokinase [Aliidiomarina sedimenti]|uniref:2-amino-4-hydroxy-6-hydroxymethyldihydropteridine diphosphokinase n=1 Tax=Aliidiomarina sedimenti TaxID=1933879 RepID=A0ABY0BX94_9GAMM|nr:2-amino-4-hydroxy-6-hydroxymethyldihydropteridine diphosphokinase [Aliidiomarina sedimenti]RUO28979.1 2-amino-4-hydroxy-6-hydroxymethyldihydropteridine diphosphokinase [Aliidiomarina sedimenti]
MTEIFIGLGSNIDPQRNIRAGVRRLNQYFSSLRLSSVYESEAVGFDGDNFLNLVVQARTDLAISQLQQLFKDIEVEHGRALNAEKYTARTLDLDLLLYDDCVQPAKGSEQPELPRGEILFNSFVLLPLAELVPHYRHPVNQLSYLSLWQSLRDSSAQVLWPVHFDWSQRS